jgi:hypothetical protein
MTCLGSSIKVSRRSGITIARTIDPFSEEHRAVTRRGPIGGANVGRGIMSCSSASTWAECGPPRGGAGFFSICSSTMHRIADPRVRWSGRASHPSWRRLWRVVRSSERMHRYRDLPRFQSRKARLTPFRTSSSCPRFPSGGGASRVRTLPKTQALPAPALM